MFELSNILSGPIVGCLVQNTILSPKLFQKNCWHPKNLVQNNSGPKKNVKPQKKIKSQTKI